MSLKTFLIGRPLDPQQEKHHRLSNSRALAILSSDALSSVAYATEQILLTLALAGSVLLQFSLPIALAICGLIAIVSVSYCQTIYAFPKGGGAYGVSKKRLGKNASLIAGASLMIDYLMTVTVSITAGVAAITSAFPILYPYKVLLCIFCLFLLTIANLRGVKETGRYFSIPVFLFVIGLFIVLLLGEFHFHPPKPKAESIDNIQKLGLWLIILRAFASGCVALTGIEAVANGVQLFRPPETRNAALTLIWMAILLIGLFWGISYLSDAFSLLPKPEETILSQLTKHIVGQSFLYYLVQISTYLILILAANTAFAGFPRLSSMLAQDGFLPKQLANRGDRLVFSNGILFLSFIAMILIILFRGETDPLIPLYTIGVFSAFTLSQSGMVRQWWVKRQKGWIRGILINGLGALTTAIVLIEVSISKFIYGAWMVVIAVPILIALMRKIKKHYNSVSNQLAVEDFHLLPLPKKHIAVIPVSGIHKMLLCALSYAKLLTNDIHCVYVEIDSEASKHLQQEWKKHLPDFPLQITPTQNRSVIAPILDYITHLQKQEGNCLITVILPTFVPLRWWQNLLHNQTSFLIRSLLLFKRNVVCTNVPLHLR